jgi:hypothetical protein
MEKKIILFVCLALFLLAPLAFAESITGYKVPSSVPLNQGITATGLYVPDGNIYANKLCSFYFFDTQNNLVSRADDQFTDATGRFALPSFVLTEPLFQRDNNYLLNTVCGTGTATSSFVVAQKQEAVDVFGWKFFPQGVGWDLKYWTNSDYIFAIIWVIVLVAFAVFAFQYYVSQKN